MSYSLRNNHSALPPLAACCLHYSHFLSFKGIKTPDSPFHSGKWQIIGVWQRQGSHRELIEAEPGNHQKKIEKFLPADSSQCCPRTILCCPLAISYRCTPEIAKGRNIEQNYTKYSTSYKCWLQAFYNYFFSGLFISLWTAAMRDNSQWLQDIVDITEWQNM